MLNKKFVKIKDNPPTYTFIEIQYSNEVVKDLTEKVKNHLEKIQHELYNFFFSEDSIEIPVFYGYHSLTDSYQLSFNSEFSKFPELSDFISGLSTSYTNP